MQAIYFIYHTAHFRWEEGHKVTLVEKPEILAHFSSKNMNIHFAVQPELVLVVVCGGDGVWCLPFHLLIFFWP